MIQDKSKTIAKDFWIGHNPKLLNSWCEEMKKKWRKEMEDKIKCSFACVGVFCVLYGLFTLLLLMVCSFLRRRRAHRIVFIPPQINWSKTSLFRKNDHFQWKALKCSRTGNFCISSWPFIKWCVKNVTPMHCWERSTLKDASSTINSTTSHLL